jgi:hypothetical protein
MSAYSTPSATPETQAVVRRDGALIAPDCASNLGSE